MIQSGFMCGRHISNNIRLILDLVDYNQFIQQFFYRMKNVFSLVSGLTLNIKKCELFALKNKGHYLVDMWYPYKRYCIISGY